MQGGKAEKETKGGRVRVNGGRGERLSFIQPCVSYSLVWRDRRKVGGGRDRGVERETGQKRGKA